MVLFGSTNLSSAYSFHWKLQGKTDINIEALRLTIGTIFFNLCEGCISAMACIPPTAFSASRIRETQRKDRDMKMSNTTKITSEPSKFFNTAFTELNPLKYNSKLMNSIWGFYNRYSPHNVKKVNDANVGNGELQQSAVNSAKNEPVITLPSSKFDNVWAAMNVSQSH